MTKKEAILKSISAANVKLLLLEELIIKTRERKYYNAYFNIISIKMAFEFLLKKEEQKIILSN